MNGKIYIFKLFKSWNYFFTFPEEGVFDLCISSSSSFNCVDLLVLLFFCRLWKLWSKIIVILISLHFLSPFFLTTTFLEWKALANLYPGHCLWGFSWVWALVWVEIFLKKKNFSLLKFHIAGCKFHHLCLFIICR